MILNKVYSMLGLAAKAGKIASGEFMTERSVKDGSACLVVVATDASDNTKKNFRDMCTYYHVPIEEYGRGVEVYELLKPHSNNEIVSDSAVKENAGNILREKRDELKKLLDYTIEDAIIQILEAEPEYVSSKS